MKKKSYYTFIFTKNNSSNLKKFSVESKYIHSALALLGIFSLILVAFLTDYLGLHVDRWKLTQLKQENKQLEQNFNYLNAQLKSLEKKVHQMSDFSKKLQLITNINPKQINSLKTMGKIHSNSAIMALSTPSFSPNIDRSPSSVTEKTEDTTYFSNPTEGSLEVRIEKLKKKSEQSKQSAWTLYTNLIEKKEILNNTPSIFPAKGWISSHFGYRNETIFKDHEPYFHRGIDIASHEGSPVFATANGKVVATGYDENGYGNFIILDHGYGLKTYYAHLSIIKTKIGASVQKGEIIAQMGNTGKSTGPHLHYEVRIFRIPVNPYNYMLDHSDLFAYRNKL